MKSYLRLMLFMVLAVMAVASIKVTAGMSLAMVMPIMRSPDGAGGGITDELKKELDEIAEGIDTKLESMVTEAKSREDKSLTAVADNLKTEVEAMVGKYNELQKELTDRVNEIETKANRLDVKSDGPKNWGTILMKALLSDDKLKNFREGITEKAVVDLLVTKGVTKADDMTGANSFESTDVVGEMRVPGIVYDPDRAEHVRDILTQGVTSQNSIGYIKEEAYSDATDVTTEGAEYKQGDFDLKLYTANVRKITNYIILSEEMLEDVEGLTSYILARLPKKIKLKEDQQILFGAGTGVQLNGIATQADAYSDALADSTVTRIDVLADAIRQVRVDEYRANYILLHPTDVSAIRLEKDTTGRYIMPWIFSGATPTVGGVPIMETTAMTADKFLVGDFTMGAQIFDRKQVAIEFSKESEDNFVKGMVTVRGSERLALAVYRPSAFTYGDFTVALAQGSA